MSLKISSVSLPEELSIFAEEEGLSKSKIVRKVLEDLRDFGKSNVRKKDVFTAAKKRELRKQARIARSSTH